MRRNHIAPEIQPNRCTGMQLAAGLCIILVIPYNTSNRLFYAIPANHVYASQLEKSFPISPMAPSETQSPRFLWQKTQHGVWEPDIDECERFYKFSARKENGCFPVTGCASLDSTPLPLQQLMKNSVVSKLLCEKPGLCSVTNIPH
jgi:hypothetical protein